MSPLSTRYSAPATDGDAEVGGGRHRRPESLADVSETASFRLVRPARNEPVPAGAEYRPRRAAGPRGRTARHAATRPPTTGAHRAPGTLPIESWLLMGRSRQGALLAALVAVGMLLVALPTEQRDAGVDAVNAAAQRAAGAQAEEKTKPAKEKDRPPAASAPDAAEQVVATPTTSAPAPAASATTPSAAPATKPAKKAPSAGPGNSLRITGTKAISLTFDDGPDPVQTPKILKLLDDYDVQGVFCLVGKQAQRHPEIVRQIVAAGHKLCNHTWDHSLTIGKDKPEQIKADLERTNAVIRQAVPDAEIAYFRAPGGNFTDRLVQVAIEDGMTSLYWEVDPRDWEHTEGESGTAHVDKIVNGIRAQTRPGSIILSHDFNQPTTITAYEKLLPWLKENFTIGLPAVPLPESPPVSPSPPAPADS